MAEPPQEIDLNEKLASLGHSVNEPEARSKGAQRVNVSRIEHLSLNDLKDKDPELFGSFHIKS
ncbi:hypothetical protein XM38_005650 [Halomicronema hongdechloris C2206]|uniref:Uncharacterized protein n=1 Tax=Halomicronema hongdechloris C2206 TaxID=1641165 RepID=A0A1Z3HH67_9CYAN|nr:hypothetical protein XM38_005650 [Halomicronema hongdechloris C2206]